ncbi:Hypothetical protein SRAE_X000130600 [Strongyloides ratti]|uniref:Uncharacterized protein n=1 Tax=Strongyloides ratti TaxID=34506 RepID=A0A090KQ97_STRRB|nr:Hypothetical protein SRAE_X000130600 [Strongyloides ratti]CEF59559.1 Hypothetical protein SRAE_X000130600 [Strongyloides ratti]
MEETFLSAIVKLIFSVIMLIYTSQECLNFIQLTYNTGVRVDSNEAIRMLLIVFVMHYTCYNSSYLIHDVILKMSKEQILRELRLA